MLAPKTTAAAVATRTHGQRMRGYSSTVAVAQTEWWQWCCRVVADVGVVNVVVAMEDLSLVAESYFGVGVGGGEEGTLAGRE
jgi:hypothetical protein